MKNILIWLGIIIWLSFCIWINTVEMIDHNCNWTIISSTSDYDGYEYYSVKCDHQISQVIVDNYNKYEIGDIVNKTMLIEKDKYHE